MEETIEKAAAAYADAAHDEMHTNGGAYVHEHFKTIEEFVEFEMDGDASDETDRLAERYDVPIDEARAVMKAALGAAELGYLNASWRKAWAETEFVSMAERDAETFVEDCYDDVDFDPEGAVDWASNTFGQDLREALAEAGFDDELTIVDRQTYADALLEHAAHLVAKRDLAVVDEAVTRLIKEAISRLHDDVFAEVEESALGAMNRLMGERRFSPLIQQKIISSWNSRY